MAKCFTQKHPSALWILSLVYALYAVSYGVLFSNLLMYTESDKIGFTQNHAFAYMASFTSLTFILPLAGGALADRFGFKNAINMGFIFCILGFFLLGSRSSFGFYLGVSCALAGNALCMPGIWAIVGMIYDKNDGRRETGSTIFYLLFNIGFLISFSCSPLMAQYLGYYKTFSIFCVGFIASFIVFILYENKISTDIHIEARSILRYSPFTNIIILFLSCLIGILISLICLEFLNINQIIVWTITLAIFFYIGYLAIKEPCMITSRKMWAFVILSIMAIAYVTIYNSEFNLLPDFISRAVNSHIGTFVVPSGMVTSLDPLFCIFIGIFLGRLWMELNAKNKNPGLATKFALGLIASALGYILLAYFVKESGTAEMSILLTIPVFVLFVMGELLVLPIGISMTGRLAPRGKEGLFMGTWTLVQGASALVTSYVASFTIISATTSFKSTNLQYFHVLLIFGIVVLILGIIFFSIRKQFALLTARPSK